MESRILTIILLSCFCLAGLPASAQKKIGSLVENIDLTGSWKLYLDPGNTGIKENRQDSIFSETIILPGTLEQNGKGRPVEIPTASHLNQSWQYTGAAWYQKEIEIPESWKGRQVQLFLERTKVSRVWLNSKSIGHCTLLSAPQLYQLIASAIPGKYKLTIMIDNTPKLVSVGGSHALSVHTQTNWNGIIGKIYLEAKNQLSIGQVKIKPDAKQRIANIQIHILNKIKQHVVLKLQASSQNSKHNHQPRALQFKIKLEAADTLLNFSYPLGADANLWSEYNPALYKLAISLVQNKEINDTLSISFGLRNFKPSGTQFTINDDTTFLRGKNDGCIFPLTGYPPMDVAAWRKVYHTAKSYGINHYRFHSYTPPEAAFKAADLEGVYIQTELPNWANFTLADTIHTNFQYREAKAILDTYGNHPSFVMFSLGNELGGDKAIHDKMVYDLKHYDGRVLFAYGTNAFYANPQPGRRDDFWVTMRTGKESPDRQFDVRGSFATTEDVGNGIINALPPSTRRNFSAAINGLRLPVIGHEIGQYQSYPDYTEIPKYKGILRPLNFELFKKRLEHKGMGAQAHDFFKASGMLSALLYREEIEMALRTPGFAGFQLLDLQDYPGQGTALVGLLNAFMESKGLISADEFRSFNNDVVLQLLMDKYTWTNTETYTADVQLVNYSPQNMGGKNMKWSIVGIAKNEPLATGEFSIPDNQKAGINPVGKIVFSLLKIMKAEKLAVKLSIPGTSYHVEYPLWVYPSSVCTATPSNVLVATKMDEKVMTALDHGARVLLFPDHNRIKDKSVGPQFISEFWNWLVFKNAAINMKRPVSAGTLGILTQPQHPLFGSFPTDPYTNWQWWSITKNARPLILDSTSETYRPIVQIIDNIDRNHKLGMIFEFKTGKGKLLVSMANLPALLNKPEARQLYHSILNYVSSDRFEPLEELSPNQLKALL